MKKGKQQQCESKTRMKRDKTSGRSIYWRLGLVSTSLLNALPLCIFTEVPVRTSVLPAVARATVMIPAPDPQSSQCPNTGERSEETRLSALTLQKHCEWMCVDRRKVTSLASSLKIQQLQQLQHLRKAGLQQPTHTQKHTFCYQPFIFLTGLMCYDKFPVYK